MPSEAQRKASSKYQQENCINKLIRFNRRSERDMQILEHIKQQENQTEYIKGLVEDDMYRM